MARLRGGSRIFGNLTVDGLLIGGNTNSVQVFATFTGSNQTYTAPTNLKRAIVFATGAGGGGGGVVALDTAAGGGGGGGAAGGTAIRIYTAAEMGSTATYTIGGGGNGGSSAGGAGTAGGNTIFTPSGGGTVLTANGGGLGFGVANVTVGSRGAGGVGGTATGGTLNIQGGDGSDGAGDDAAEISFGGRSGSSFWGGGGRGASAQGAESTAGLVGKAYGSGGGGGAIIDTTTGAVGGAGINGAIFVLEFT
jgi:hypothetical protein